MTAPRINLIPWLLGVLTLSLAAAAWLWFERNFERRTLEVPTGWSNAAKRNPFLAAERFLQRIGVEVESAPGRALLRDLPPPGDMLVVNGMDALNTRRRELLRQWLEDGGQLLIEATQVLAPGEMPRANDFLAEVGVLLRANVDADDGEAVAEIEFVAYPEPVEVGFVASFFLEDAKQQAIASARADGLPRLLQYRIGDGLLTVTSDNIFLTNADIAHHDHALALALLSADVNKVWLIHDHAAPDLGTLLWNAAPQAIIAGTLLIAVLIWHLGGTIGPLLPTPARVRRDLSDHLEAAAALMWRQGRGGLLMEATRKRIEKAWLRRHPLLHDMEPAVRARWISEQLGADTSAGQVYDALYQRHHSAQDFMAQSRLLQRLWSAL
ncbi:MAG: DUF4350 domain-containing protein [Thiohalocapsa sp.]